MKSPDRDAADELERVARAICAADNHAWPEDDYNGRFQRRAFEAQARAAMAAMPSASELATFRRRVADMEGVIAELLRCSVSYHIMGDAYEKLIALSPPTRKE